MGLYTVHSAQLDTAPVPSERLRPDEPRPRSRRAWYRRTRVRAARRGIRSRDGRGIAVVKGWRRSPQFFHFVAKRRCEITNLSTKICSHTRLRSSVGRAGGGAGARTDVRIRKSRLVCEQRLEQPHVHTALRHNCQFHTFQRATTTIRRLLATNPNIRSLARTRRGRPHAPPHSQQVHLTYNCNPSASCPTHMVMRVGGRDASTDSSKSKRQTLSEIPISFTPCFDPKLSPDADDSPSAPERPAATTSSSADESSMPPRRNDLKPHEIALLVMVGFVVALTLGSTMDNYRRAIDGVEAISVASEESAYEAALRGGFDGRDDQLVVFDDTDEPTALKTAQPPAQSERQDVYFQFQTTDSDEAGSIVPHGDPAMLF
jgi:hypothetical protein